MDFSAVLLGIGVLLLIISIVFLTLAWSTLEEAREFFQRENQKHRNTR